MGHGARHHPPTARPFSEFAMRTQQSLTGSVGLIVVKQVVLQSPVPGFNYRFRRALTARGRSEGAGRDASDVTDGVRKSSEGRKDCPVAITEGQLCVLNQEHSL